MKSPRSIVGAGLCLVGSLGLMSWMGCQPDISKAPAEQRDLNFVGGKTTFTMSRDKAIDFGLNQINSAIKYMFVAAGALLAIIVRLLIHPLTAKDAATFPKVTVDWLGCGAMGLLFSILWGILGHLFLVNLSTSGEFSIYREPAIACCGQLIFVLASGSVVIGTLFGVTIARR